MLPPDGIPLIWFTPNPNRTGILSDNMSVQPPARRIHQHGYSQCRRGGCIVPPLCYSYYQLNTARSRPCLLQEWLAKNEHLVPVDWPLLTPVKLTIIVFPLIPTPLMIAQTQHPNAGEISQAIKSQWHEPKLKQPSISIPFHQCRGVTHWQSCDLTSVHTAFEVLFGWNFWFWSTKIARSAAVSLVGS